MKVEVIKAQENNKNLVNPRKIERMRVAAYCRVSTDDEDQIKSKVKHPRHLCFCDRTDWS